MNKITLRNYLETNAKYNKLKKRFDKNIKSGSFYEFSKKKQKSLMYRLRKLHEKLLRLKNLLKLATAGVTMALALTAGQANAQDFKNHKPFKGKFKTELNGQKSFESDLFLQVTGLNNPFGGENPLDGQLVSNASYTNLVDIDNDGDLDVFSLIFDNSSSYYIKYYKNEGNNTRANLTEQTGTDNPFDGLVFDSRPYMSFVDIDNDADFDVFINNQSADEIYYYENTGTNTSPEFVEQTGGNNSLDGIDPMDMDQLNFADIDNDGDLDVFIGTDTNYPSYPYLYRNTGSVTNPIFTLEDASGLFDDSEYSYEYLVLSDLDNDGDLDAIISYNQYYENQGNSSSPYFVKQDDAGNPFSDINRYGTNLFLADIDGDSDLDLFFGNGEAIFYYENVGDISNPAFEDQNGGIPSTRLTFPDFIDIDNDGDYDMFVAGYDTGSTLKLNYFKNIGTNGSPEFEQQTGSNNPMNNFNLTSYVNTPEFVDIDADGDFDLFFGADNYYSSIGLIPYFKNVGDNENPIFELQSDENNPVSHIEGDMAFLSFLDIDNDGDYDLFRGSVTYYGDNALSFYRNTGTNTDPLFVEETSSIILSSNIHGCFPEFVDIDDDGDYDFFAGMMDYDTDTWGINHYKNIGTSEEADFVEQTGSDHPLDIQAYLAFPVFVDIDADSDQDCFIGIEGGQFLYFRNKTFSNSVDGIKENSLKLYPNPTSGIVVFETEIFGNEAVRIEITELTGKTISNYRLVDYNKIDLSDLKAGIYFIKISTGLVSEVSKIVVQ